MKWRIFWIALILMILIIIDWAGWLYQPRSFIQSISAPILKFTWQINLKSFKFVTAFFSAQKLEIDNQRLKEENAQLLSRLVRFQEIEKENIFLRQQLSQANEEQYSFLLAKIISRSPDNFSFQILIDKGTKNEVQIGQAVIAIDKVLIGKVADVYEKTALVMLLNNQQFKTEIFTSESLASGILKGNSNNLVIDFIPKDKQLKPEELVITSGGDGLPRGLIIGKIQSFSSKTDKLFQDISVSPIFNNLSFNDVFVIIHF